MGGVPFLCRGGLVDGGAKQRVAKRHPVPLDTDQAGLLGWLQWQALERRSRLLVSGGEEKRFPGRRGQGAQGATHVRSTASDTGSSSGSSAPPMRSSSLSSGGTSISASGLPPVATAIGRATVGVSCVPERSRSSASAACSFNGSSSRWGRPFGRERLPLAVTSGEEQRDRFRGEATGIEGERLGRGRIEPMGVVDDDEQRTTLGRHVFSCK